MTLVADSGSTKTAWAVDGRTVMTQGLNPFQMSEEDVCGVLHHELLPALTNERIDTAQIESIFFYGAGCTPEKAPVVAAALRRVVCASACISVESDMLGAARALCGNEPGIVCILGTGSNSCFYDGRSIAGGMPALGYILGDEGSGAYMGKRLVGDVLKRQLPDDVCSLFFSETHATQASIIQRVYREPLANRYLASLSTFCAKHRDIPAVRDLAVDCFVQFFRRNLNPLPHRGYAVHFAGSIAHFYRSELAEAAQLCGYEIGNIVQAPLDGLVKYHAD